MGVSAATLRAWADQGRVESYRTPGGHRRFRVGHGDAPLKPEAKRTEARWRLLESAALGRVQNVREETESAPLLPLSARVEYRSLDRSLVRLCALAISKGEGAVGARAQELGSSLGKWNWRYGVTAQEGYNSLAAFRRAVVESVVEFAFGLGEPNIDELNLWLSRANQVIDRVCLSMIEFRSGDTVTHVGK
jgi:hypothetical protein